MTVISISNQKGGSAKTTTAIHLGAGLAQLGKKVLLVDMDPQGHVAEGLGISALELPHELGEVLERKVTLKDILIRHKIAGLDIAPANIKLASTESVLFNKPRREDRLKNALHPYVSSYDFILIDCPPSLGLLTINALSAADHVLIPMATEYYAMLGVSLLLETIEMVKEEINSDLTTLGVLPTRYQMRYVNAREVVEKTRHDLEGVTMVYEMCIPETVKFREAAAAGKTIYELAPDTPGANAYMDLSREVANAQQ